MAKKGQRHEKNELNRALQIVYEKINEGNSYTNLSEEYGVSKRTIKNWLH